MARKKKKKQKADAEEIEGPCFQVVEIPNKGMGVRANRPIACGEIILEVVARET